MKHDNDRLKRKKLLNLTDNIFGRPEEWAEEELDLLYEQISPKRDPKEWIRSTAQEAARSYRLKGQNVPNHVQAVLDATSERTIQDAKPSEMKTRIDSLLSPKPPLKMRPSFSFRKQPGGKISEKDRELLDGLADELNEKEEEEL